MLHCPKTAFIKLNMAVQTLENTSNKKTMFFVELHSQSPHGRKIISTKLSDTTMALHDPEEGPKMALKASKNAPNWPPKAPTWAPRAPRWTLGRPLWARDGSKRAFLIPKIAFMILEMAPRWPLSCAPLPQDGLHEAQDGPCDVLHCPKTAFIKFKMAVQTPKKHRKQKTMFFVEFHSQSPHGRNIILPRPF